MNPQLMIRMKKINSSYKITITLAIIFSLYNIVVFAKQVYSLQIGEQVEYLNTDPITSVIYYLITIPLLFGVRKLLTEIRGKPLYKIFTFFIILYITDAILTIGESINHQLYMAFFTKYGSVSPDIPDYNIFEVHRMLGEFFQATNAFLKLLIKLFTLLFSINLLLPGRGNNSKLKLLGISLFIYIMTGVVFSIFYSELFTNYRDFFNPGNEAMLMLYEQRYITLFYIQGTINMISILFISLSIVNLSLFKGLTARVSKANAYRIGKICCVAGIMIIPTLLVITMSKGLNEYYKLLPELLLSLILIIISILTAYYYQSEREIQIRKGFEKLAYVQALLIVPYINMMNTFIDSCMRAIQHDVSIHEMIGEQYYTIVFSLMLIFIYIFFVIISNKLAKYSSKKLDHTFGYVLFISVCVSVSGIILVLTKTIDLEYFKLIGFPYLPYLTMLIGSFMLLNKNKQECN